jgi:hypothetical protein
MNLLGMKRKLLPYGMALGGAGGSIGSALGAMGAASNSASSAAPSSSGGGKSAPVGQNNYSAPFAGGGGAAGPNMGGGKSSGLGAGGYGAAPAFGVLQPTAQTQPSTAQSPFPPTPLNSSVNTTTQQDMMGGNSGGGQGLGQALQSLGMLGGGKSSGAGQGGYGGAPGFGGMNNMLQGQPANNLGQFGDPRSGNRITPGFENMVNNPEFNMRMRGSSGGAQMQAPTREGYDSFMARAKFAPGTQPTYEQWAKGQQDRAAEQAAGAEAFNQYQMAQPGFGAPPPQQVQQPFVNPRGAMSPEMQAYYAQDFANQAIKSGGQRPPQQGMGALGGFGGMGGRFQQPRFNPFQQQQTPESLYAANMGLPPPPQRGISGLQSLYSNMMNQQQQMQQPMQRMPRFQSQALQYRPDMTQAQAALSRVKPSVQKQNQDAQAARIAELEAQLAGYQTPAPSTNDYGGGG